MKPRAELQYLRQQKLRDPALVLSLSLPLIPSLSPKKESDLAIFEQLIVAGCDLGEFEVVKQCLGLLKEQFGAIVKTVLPAEPGKEPKVKVEGSSRVGILEGKFLEAQGDYSGATELYNLLLTQNPANVLASKRLCAIQKAIGTPAEAVKSLLSYLDSNPTDVAGWWELAELYLSQGHWQGAATAFEEVVLFDPLSHEVHTKLGECYYGMAASSKDGVCKDFSGEGMMAMARRHFAEALNLKRGNLRALMGLRMASRETALRPANVNDKKDVALVDGSVADIEVAQKLHEFACEEIERVTKGKYGKLGLGLKEIGRTEGEEILAAMASKGE